MLAFLSRWWRSLWETPQQERTRRIYESMNVWGSKGTLAGLPKFLRLYGVHRARIYEVSNPQVLVLVVPRGTPLLRDLNLDLQENWLPLAAQAVIFPILEWWECRWSGIQVHTWAGSHPSVSNQEARRKR